MRADEYAINTKLNKTENVLSNESFAFTNETSMLVGGNAWSRRLGFVATNATFL